MAQEVDGGRQEDRHRAEREHAGPENQGERRELLKRRHHESGAQTQAEPKPSERHGWIVYDYIPYRNDAGT